MKEVHTFVIGLVSLGAIETTGETLVQHLASDFQDKLDQPMASSADSLQSL